MTVFGCRGDIVPRGVAWDWRGRPWYIAKPTDRCPTSGMVLHDVTAGRTSRLFSCRSPPCRPETAPWKRRPI